MIARLRVNLAVGCPCVGATLCLERRLSTASALMRAAGPAGLGSPCELCVALPAGSAALKQIRREVDELLARSEILSYWASAFAIEATCSVFSPVPGRRGGTQGPALPDAPLSEEPEGSPGQRGLI